MVFLKRIVLAKPFAIGLKRAEGQLLEYAVFVEDRIKPRSPAYYRVAVLDGTVERMDSNFLRMEPASWGEDAGFWESRYEAVQQVTETAEFKDAIRELAAYATAHDVMSA